MSVSALGLASILQSEGASERLNAFASTGLVASTGRDWKGSKQGVQLIRLACVYVYATFTGHRRLDPFDPQPLHLHLRAEASPARATRAFEYDRFGHHLVPGRRNVDGLVRPLARPVEGEAWVIVVEEEA